MQYDVTMTYKILIKNFDETNPKHIELDIWLSSLPMYRKYDIDKSPDKFFADLKTMFQLEPLPVTGMLFTDGTQIIELEAA